MRCDGKQTQSRVHIAQARDGHV